MIANPFRRSGFRLPLGRPAPAFFLPSIMALTVYLAELGGIGLVAVADGVHRSQASLADRMTLQVPPDASPARLNTVLALLRQTHGVVAVHPLEAAETARLVEPWLGSSVAIDRLPVPRIIDLQVDGISAAEFTDLRHKLALIVPDAQLDEHAPLLEHAERAAARLTSVIAAVLAVIVLTMVVSAAADARSGLLLHREYVELLHLLGAGDDQIARQFQRQALQFGLIGGVVGTLAAAITMLVLDSAGSALQLPSPIVGDGIADRRVWLILIGTAIAAAIVAMTAARVTVLRRLAQMP